MPKIIIKEADYTGESAQVDLTNAVYVPGFSINDPSDDTYVLGEPTLYTNVEDFESSIGDKPLSFHNNAWDSTKEYFRFEVVEYEGEYYASKIDNNIGHNPSVDTSNYWYTNEVASWDSNKVSYDVGTMVSYDDKIYVNRVGENSGWNVQPNSSVVAWSDSTTYTKYSLVLNPEYPNPTIGDKIYVNITGENGSEAPGIDTTNWVGKTIASSQATGLGEFSVCDLLDNFYVKTIEVTPNQAPNIWQPTMRGTGVYSKYNIAINYDIAYLYAHTLLELGLPIYYEVVNNGENEKCSSVEEFYESISDGDLLYKLSDKGSYSIKYLTIGGYPIYKDAENNLIHNAIAPISERADAIALVDHVQGLSADPTAQDNAFYTLNHLTTQQDNAIFNVTTSWLGGSTIDGGSYATMLTPWANYTLERTYKIDGEIVRVVEMPASFYYLVCLAKSIKNNPDWLAIAGVTRGLDSIIDQKGEKPVVTNKMADAYMTEGMGGEVHGRSINGITNIRPYGLTIWGNRTLLKNTNDHTTQSLAYLNIRAMVCDVKKTVFAAAQRFMFEQNNDVLWINFKSAITPLLDKLSTTGGISGYKIIKQKSKTTAKLCATIILYPIYAVEEIEVNIELRNEEVTIA